VSLKASLTKDAAPYACSTEEKLLSFISLRSVVQQLASQLSVSIRCSQSLRECDLSPQKVPYHKAAKFNAPTIRVEAAG
jgi:hypothetical protein